MTAAIAVIVRLVMKCVLEQPRIRPCVAEVILRASAERRRKLLTVDEEFFVPFAPPTSARIPDVQHHSDKSACALRFENRPVNLALRLSRKKRVAMPFGMKPGK